MRFRAHGFPYRIDIWEKSVRYVRTDEYNFPSMVVIGFVDEAPLRHVDVAYLCIIGGNPHDVGVFQALISGAHVNIVLVECGNGVGGLHAIPHALVIVHRDKRALLRLDPCVLTRDDAEAIHDKDIGAEVGDAVRHVKVHPGDDAHYGHKCGYGQNDAEQGQKTAQFVRAQGVQRQPHGFHQGHGAAAQSSKRNSALAGYGYLRELRQTF